MTGAEAARTLPGAIPDAALVFAARRLRDGVDLESTARFGDDAWDLLPIVLQRHQKTIRLDFLTTPARFRPVAKQLFYAQLTLDLPPAANPHSVFYMRADLSRLNLFFTWAGDRGHTSLAEITEDELAVYRERVRARRISTEVRLDHWRTLGQLWLYRTRLVDALAIDPTPLIDADPDFALRRASENTTARIPEQVISPLLVWALRWTGDFADDIAAGQREWATLNAQKALNRRGLPRTSGSTERLAALLDRYRAERRPLPRAPLGPRVPQASVNVAHLAREIECTPGLTGVKAKALIQAALDDCGLAADTFLRTPVTGLLDGSRWKDQLSYFGIEQDVRFLRAAAYIVIAYLSGMRDAEVKHLRRGCLTSWNDEDGRVIRRKVESLAFKGEDDPAGVKATWIVAEPVARAIKVLEDLLDPSEQYLFAPVNVSRKYGYQRRLTSDGVQTTKSTLDDVNDFITWINSYCSEHGRADSIPDVDGHTWHLSTRQFRRTLAWFIARQPGGSIAGAMQYRHVSVRIFEGYAGTSEAGFRAEVEAEEALARGDKLGGLVVSGEYLKLTGPAAAEAEQRLAEFERNAEFTGKVVTDRKRLLRIMTRHDPNIHPGEYVTCVYNPDRALCTKTARDAPLLEDCQPFACRNVALTAENRDELDGHLTVLTQQLGRKDVLAPYLRDRLEQRRTEITTFLSRYAATQAAHHTTPRDTTR